MAGAAGGTIQESRADGVDLTLTTALLSAGAAGASAGTGLSLAMSESATRTAATGAGAGVDDAWAMSVIGDAAGIGVAGAGARGAIAMRLAAFTPSLSYKLALISVTVISTPNNVLFMVFLPEFTLYCGAPRKSLPAASGSRVFINKLNVSLPPLVIMITYCGSTPQHFLNFFPLPHVQSSFLPTFGSSRLIVLTAALRSGTQNL